MSNGRRDVRNRKLIAVAPPSPSEKGVVGGASPEWVREQLAKARAQEEAAKREMEARQKESMEPSKPSEKPYWRLISAWGVTSKDVEMAATDVGAEQQRVVEAKSQLQEYLNWRPATDVKTLGEYLREGGDLAPNLIAGFQRKHKEYKKFYEKEYEPTYARYKSAYNVHETLRGVIEGKETARAEEMRGLVTEYFKGEVPTWAEGLLGPTDFAKITSAGFTVGRTSPESIARRHLKEIVSSIAVLPVSRWEKLEMIGRGIAEPSEIKVIPEMVPAEAELYFGGMPPAWYAAPGTEPTPTEKLLFGKREKVGEYLVEKGTPLYDWRESLFGQIPIVGEVGAGVLQAAEPWGRGLRELGESISRGGRVLTGRWPWEGRVFTTGVAYSPAERMGGVPYEFPVPEPPGLISLESVGAMIFYYGAFKGVSAIARAGAKGAGYISRAPAKIVETGIKFLGAREPSPFSVSARMELEFVKASARGAWEGIKWGAIGEKVTELRVIQEYPQRLGWVSYRTGGVFSFPMEIYTELTARAVPALSRGEVPPGLVPSEVVPKIGTRLPETHTLVYPRQVPITSRWAFEYLPGREFGEELTFTKATTKLVAGKGVIMVPKEAASKLWYSLRIDTTQLLYPYTRPVKVTKVVPRAGVSKTLVSETYLPAAELQRVGISETLYVGKPYHAATIEDIAFRYTQFEPLEFITGKGAAKQPFATFDPRKFATMKPFTTTAEGWQAYYAKIAKQKVVKDILGGVSQYQRVRALEPTIGKIMGPRALVFPATTPSLTIGQVMGPAAGFGALMGAWTRQKPAVGQRLNISSIARVRQVPYIGQLPSIGLEVGVGVGVTQTQVAAQVQKVAQAQRTALVQDIVQPIQPVNLLSFIWPFEERPRRGRGPVSILPSGRLYRWRRFDVGDLLKGLVGG